MPSLVDITQHNLFDRLMLMARAPYQVLVFPFRLEEGAPLYALFRRNAATGGYWQGIAGGGEGEETPLEAARREAGEEAGIEPGAGFIALDAMAMIPVVNVCGFLWGEEVLVIPEYAFGVAVGGREMMLSHEHTEYAWHDIESALRMVAWDSNRTALWELDQRVRRAAPLPP